MVPPAVSRTRWVGEKGSVYSMNQELLRIVDALCRDKNIDKETVFEDLEAAKRSAIRKSDTECEDVTVHIDRESGEISAMIDGEPKSIRDLGRIPAQTAKQVIIQRLREAGLTTQAYIISDEAVFARYGKQAEAALALADIPVASYTVPQGEASKSLDTAGAIYDWLIGQRAERGHAVVALGGGMVTDLAGYVAATYARGLPLVHVPTSLLAMVDAAIGGKVAVNHPRSKNAIGAFYQPRFVLADVSTLRTLPPRELSGWAEAIKHAMILDADLLAFFEEHADAVLRLEPEPTTEAIRRSVAIKAAVVSEDEREETGRRTVLNYGHTVGHAIEAVTGRLIECYRFLDRRLESRPYLAGDEFTMADIPEEVSGYVPWQTWAGQRD
ncbi:hypothetical protein LCGC14_2878670, partial [marine sediment metagenome]